MLVCGTKEKRIEQPVITDDIEVDLYYFRAYAASSSISPEIQLNVKPCRPKATLPVAQIILELQVPRPPKPAQAAVSSRRSTSYLSSYGAAMAEILAGSMPNTPSVGG